MKIYDVEHYPVFHRELLEYLPAESRFVLDGTFGHGGLANHILSGLNTVEKYYALDRDPAVIEYFRTNGLPDSRIELFYGDFSDSATFPAVLKKPGSVCAVILDLGCSQYQLKEGARGFSFLHEGPLDMRMDTGKGPTLKEWLQKAREEEIYRVLRDFGEERYAGRIARRIFEHRHSLQTTSELAALIARSVPSRGGWQKIHPATRSFQALRILLNRELDCLESALNGLLPCLRSGGRLMVVSFHSLEDRIIKQCFRGWEDGDRGMGSSGYRVNKKVIFPSAAELSENPPSRSAKLRIFEKY